MQPIKDDQGGPVAQTPDPITTYFSNNTPEVLTVRAELDGPLYITVNEAWRWDVINAFAIAEQKNLADERAKLWKEKLDRAEMVKFVLKRDLGIDLTGFDDGLDVPEIMINDLHFKISHQRNTDFGPHGKQCLRLKLHCSKCLDPVSVLIDSRERLGYYLDPQSGANTDHFDCGGEAD